MENFNDFSFHSFKSQLSDVSLFLFALSIVSFVWYASNVNEAGKYYKQVKFLGAITYPLCLIHPDIGFRSHAIFEHLLWYKYPSAKITIGYGITIFIVIFLSFFISSIYIKYFDKSVNNAAQLDMVIWIYYNKKSIKNQN